MITKVEIENYKSIRKLTLELGRMNVFIGENGCGKTNILEAITLGSAASRGKLDNEYLIPRGIRVTKPELMRSAFAADEVPVTEVRFFDGADRAEAYRPFQSPQSSGLGKVPDCLIFSIESSALRRRDYDGPLFPFGVKGEGLLAHLQELAAKPSAPAIAAINEHLALIDWFEHLDVPSREMAEQGLRIRDRYLAEGVVFDQKSANEGFLFLLFYLTLFISPHTPRFFAIDNVDVSLNPKLCQALMASMVTLAKQHDKQAIVTTHNPSLLDALNLHDDDQRLFVVSRNDDGETQIHRVPPPKPLGTEPPVRLSTAFLRGYIGGLPKNF